VHGTRINTGFRALQSQPQSMAEIGFPATVNQRVVGSPSVPYLLKVAKANHRIRRIWSRLQSAFTGVFGKPQKEFHISENAFSCVLHPRNCEILQPHFRLLLSPKRPVRRWSVGVVGILGNDRTVTVQ